MKEGLKASPNTTSPLPFPPLLLRALPPDLASEEEVKEEVTDEAAVQGLAFPIFHSIRMESANKLYPKEEENMHQSNGV